MDAKNLNLTLTINCFSLESQLKCSIFFRIASLHYPNIHSRQMILKRCQVFKNRDFMTILHPFPQSNPLLPHLLLRVFFHNHWTNLQDLQHQLVQPQVHFPIIFPNSIHLNPNIHFLQSLMMRYLKFKLILYSNPQAQHRTFILPIPNHNHHRISSLRNLL